MANNISLSDLKRSLPHCDLSIVDGLLVIRDFDPERQTKAESWLRENYDQIREVICSAIAVPLYIYTDYNADKFGDKYHSGVALNFIQTKTGEEFYTIFNADLKHAKGQKKGRRFSNKKQFRIGRGTKFQKALIKWGIPKPRKPAEWWRQMGKLRGRIFIADVSLDGRSEMLIKDSLDTLGVPADVLKEVILKADEAAPAEKLNIDLSLLFE